MDKNKEEGKVNLSTVSSNEVIERMKEKWVTSQMNEISSQILIDNLKKELQRCNNVMSQQQETISGLYTELRETKEEHEQIMEDSQKSETVVYENGQEVVIDADEIEDEAEDDQ